ncbi:hypothetical protein TSUD_75370 [Trifolium subterraneum]|nr:hypothetical protein TSUD_75370 [Trifolium subterraneum]
MIRLQVGRKNTKTEGQGHTNSVVLGHKLENKCKCEVEINDGTTLSNFKQEDVAKSDKQEISYSQVNWLNNHSTNYATVPNLDLTLAVASPKKTNKTTPAGPLLFGPISVT